MRKGRLTPLTEAEAYARCHGDRESEIRIVHLPPRRPRYVQQVSGEDLRRSFEAKLALREPEPVAEPSAQPAVEQPLEASGPLTV